MIDKEYLNRHLQKRKELLNELQQYEVMSGQSQLRAIVMDGMPHGSSTEGDSAFYSVLEKVQTEEKIRNLQKQIAQEYQDINNLFEQLVYPMEKKIMKMHYFQCLGWSEITAMEFKGRHDYYTCMDKYKSKVYRIHNSALRHLKEIQEEGK